jgi:hypothetical protein
LLRGNRGMLRRAPISRNIRILRSDLCPR